MHIFYTPQIADGIYTLTEDESKHCVKVLRLAKGDEISLIDGIGGYYLAAIDDANPKHCTFSIRQKTKNFCLRPYRVSIAIAPTKNIDRTEWFVEKAVEMGIDEITMLVCQRSERRSVNMERIEKIVLSAMKQSIKAYRPLLNAPTPFADFVTSPRNGLKLIAHCMETDRVSLKSMVGAERDYTVLIGPEGDFSPEEVELAVRNGYQCVHLGPSRLRTETAGVAACHTINLLKQEE
ncbi:MAG: 16S rRNA (uracil(1498)-N(3))-methyltransferase [Salinivirgaceae bacterium]|nr:16S rRNA (uracil(1498)-N(3))-methyltransferase [Salinivirgaceae bacterium]